MLLAAAVAAAIAIPLASGADKPYTLEISSIVPAAKSVAAPVHTLCAGQEYTITLKLSNKTNSQSLGSADVAFPGQRVLNASNAIVPPLSALPSNSVVDVDESSASFVGGNGASTRTFAATTAPNLLRLRQLELPRKTGFVTVAVTVTASAAPSGPARITAVVKQANDFNDSGGEANLFNLSGQLPELKVENCLATIKGQIWNDQDENGTKGSFESLQRPTDSVDPVGVSLFVRNGSVYDPSGIAPVYAASGYTFTVPTGRDYVVCETSSSTWKQTTGDDLSSLSPASPCSSSLPKGYAMSNLSGDVTGKDFGNANVVSVDCDEPSTLRQEIFVASTGTRYTVQIKSDTCKSGAFVLEAYAPDSSIRVANFHPVNGGGGTIFVVEKMEWSYLGLDQPDPANRRLNYDDDLTDSYPKRAMPYCLLDPRVDGSDFDLEVTTGVLPTGATPAHSSCLISTSESADTSTGGKRVDFAYSSLDGLRTIPG